MWSVRVLSGQQAGTIFDLKLGKNIFGRAGSSHFKIQSVGISKEHCEVHVYKDKMMIVDLKSSNGTFVNGVKIQNSLVRVGDKISLFDVIMDLIPTPDIRPKSSVTSQKNAVVATSPSPPTHFQPPIAIPSSLALQSPMAYQQQSYPVQPEPLLSHLPPPPPLVQPTFNEKVENFIEDKVMPAIYKLAVIFSFKQILISFIILFIFGVTLLSMIPLTTIVKESNMIEAKKRARSVARAMAKVNEQALLSGQMTNLSVQEALKEDGIKEAFIVQHTDGAIVAPTEKAGRETTNAFILLARKESRATVDVIGSNLIGASYPIGVYDPATGEPTVKYHAIVMYDVTTLSLNQERVISLFMQTLVIASVLGLILYFLFSRLIEFPIRNLNTQIDKALIEKSDRTEVFFDYPQFQKLVSNVNTLLNRVWNADSMSGLEAVPAENKDIEFSNVVEMISHPAFVVDHVNRLVAMNRAFESLAQCTRELVLNQSYNTLTDSALVQNIESLMVRCIQSPYEKQVDRIPFSQFECDINCQAFLNASRQPEYFLMTLIQLEST